MVANSHGDEKILWDSYRNKAVFVFIGAPTAISEFTVHLNFGCLLN